MLKRLIILLAVLAASIFPIHALAVPQLGVIDTDLLATIKGTTPVGMDGFLFPDDGRITVWWGNESGIVDVNANVWIVTNAGPEAIFSVNSINFYLSTSISGSSGSRYIDGYNKPYYGANLGSISSPDSPWIPANNSTVPDLVTGSGAFYLISGVFSGVLRQGSWIFAIADINKNGIYENGSDLFSPKTTSTVVPEPATVILLGSGLIGLAILRRKRLQKKD